MNSSWGKNINLSLFGESHGKGIGVVIQGLPSGLKLDLDAIKFDMSRRMPKQNGLSTTRKEADEINILSGYFNGYTTGTPLTLLIENTDTRSKDYSKTKDLLRPSHADYSGYVRYKGFNDYRGGGHFSGRLTAPIVFAGAIAKQILAERNIKVVAHISQIKDVYDDKLETILSDESLLNKLQEKELSIINDDIAENVKAIILDARKNMNSIGGKIACSILGVQAGVGNPFFDSLESTIAHLAFSVPAVKGISFGIGEEFASKLGSEVNDPKQVKMTPYLLHTDLPFFTSTGPK